MKKRSGGTVRVRWWNLTRENAAKLSEKIRAGVNWELTENADAMWDGMAQGIHRSVEEVV